MSTVAGQRPKVLQDNSVYPHGETAAVVVPAAVVRDHPLDQEGHSDRDGQHRN
jgi:hypothetical protein